MSRLTREQPYEGFTLLIIWDLGHTFAFTEGRWRGDVITGRERGMFGLVEIALDTASTEKGLQFKFLNKTLTTYTAY